MKTQEAIKLGEEIEIRRRLNEEFDSLTAKGLTVARAGDLESLAALLSEVIETRKQAEKQEKELKAELKRYFAEGSQVLDCGRFVALLDTRSRGNLMKEEIEKVMGTEFISKFTKQTFYETLVVKTKAGGR